MNKYQIQEEKCTRMLSSLQQDVKNLKSESDATPDLKRQMESLTIVLRAFELDVAACEFNDREQYKGKIKLFKRAVRKLKREYDFDEKHEVVFTDEKDEKSLINHGKNIMDESGKSLKRSADVVVEIGVIAKKTAEEVDKQGDQIKSIIEENDKLESTIDRSKKVISEMARRVATDKITWGLIVLIIIAIALYVYFN